ncbi:MAG: HD domain-containing protein [Pirellulaceae bacterium]|nr:HD domain-containing protein [Pirellulaceae bacterium]
MSTVSTNRPSATTESPIRPVAVIDIGATNARMAIAEIDGRTSQVRLLETLSQPVSLGKDTFGLQRIRKTSIEQCVKVLASYRKLMQEYGITRPDQMRIVATSAVREASNRLAFIDRIFIATGLVVEPLDEAEVNRVTYMGIQPLIQSSPALVASKTVVVEVGSGSTEILVVRGGNVLFSNTYRLGSLRMLEQLDKFNTPQGKQRGILETQIQRFVDVIRDHIDSDTRLEMVAIGGDIRFAAANILSEVDVAGLAKLARASLGAFSNKLAKMSEDEIVQQYGLTFQDAETIVPAVLSYLMLAKRLGCESLHVAPTNLRDGLLNDLAMHATWTAEFRNQIIRSAVNLGRKFSFDEKHARHVAMLARKLFADMQTEHQLDQRMELLLYLAAILFEIGHYVNVRSNHKHAMYLIRNSELFGLSRRDLLLVSLVARYHRRSSPQPDHEGYATLERTDRVAVAKLAAILRIAVALDETRSQRVNKIKCDRDGDRFVIQVAGVEELSLEQLTLRQTGNLFEEVFGMNVLLRTSRGK